MITYEYYEAKWSDEECTSDITVAKSYDIESVAELIAEDRFSDWEYKVPEFIMVRKKGSTEPWVKLVIEVDIRPEFSARKVKCQN